METVQNVYGTVAPVPEKLTAAKLPPGNSVAGKLPAGMPRLAEARRIWGAVCSALGVLLAATAAMLSVPAATFAQLTTPAVLEPLGLKMVGTSATGAAQQGHGVAISGDGLTAVVGGFQDNGGIGAAWIYTQSGGVWSQQGGKLLGTGAVGTAGMGYAVAISYDGNTVALGGLGDNSEVGAVWVFTRSAGAWTQQGNKLVGMGGTPPSLQGESVALSFDGNTLAVGGPVDNGNVGAVWVYTRSGGAWAQQGDPLVGSGGGEGSNHGNAVALSGNGNTLIDGASGDNSGAGAVWVFTRAGSTWSQQGSKLIGSGATGAADQGSAVAASGDGNTLVEGGSNDNSGTGGLWVFTRSGGIWTQQGNELISNGTSADSFLGAAVAMSRDGDVILAGAPQEGESGGGGVAEFILSGGNWTQLGSDLAASDGDATASQGNSVGLSADGTTGIEGGPQDTSGTGAAWILSTQTNFGAATLYSTITQTIMIGAPAGGYTFGGFQVSTQGSTSQDYQASSAQPSSGACVLGTFYAAGATCAVNVDFTPTAPGVRAGAVVVFNNGTPAAVTETVYLTAVGQGSMLTVISGVIITVAGNGMAGYTGDGDPSTSAELNGPYGLTNDGNDNLFIADLNNSVIREVNSNTLVISTIAGDGTAGFMGDGSAATAAELQDPQGMVVDGAGNLYIADTVNHAVRMVSAASGKIITVAGMGGTPAYTGDGGLATAATLHYPQGVVVDPTGILYIADEANNAVRKVNVAGVITTVVGGNGRGYSGDGGPASGAQLFGPIALAMDAAGDLYIDDDGNNVIRRVDATTGIITTYAGVQGSGGFSGDGGPATSAEMNDPEGIALDAAGNLYITDSSNNVVREVSASQGTIFSIAGQGNPNVTGYTGDGGAATAALLNYPVYPAVDPYGNLFIADDGNNVVRLVNGAAPLTFGTILVGADSAAMSFTIANSGNAVLSLSGLYINGDFAFGTSETCTGATLLNPGDTCVVSVIFTPTMAGTRTGSVGVGDPIVNLSGTGQLVSTATTLMTSPNPAAMGATVTFTATVAPVPTGSSLGTVSFYNGSTLLGTGTVNSSGVATYTTSSLAVGPESITAVYSGNAGFATSTSSAVTETITASSTSTTTALMASPTTAAAGATVTFTATISPSPTGSPVGTVYFCDAGSGGPDAIRGAHARVVRPHVSACGSGTQIGSATPNGSGVATFTTTSLAAGTHDITAVYGGNAGFAASTSSVVTETITVGSTSTTTTLTAAPNPAVAGATVTLTATVAPAPTGSPLGTVSFYDGSTPLGMGTVNGSGVATFTTAALSSGPHSLTAVYSGNATFATSTSSAVTETITSSNTSTTTTLAAAPNPAAVGATVTFTATVAPAPTGSPLGTVSFYDGSTLQGMGTVNGSGVATFTTAALSVGPHSITALYSGNATFATSTSTAVTQTISGPVATTETIMAAPNPATFGQTVTFTATISPAPTGTPTGTVVFCEPPTGGPDMRGRGGAKNARAEAVWKRGTRPQPAEANNGCGAGIFLGTGTVNGSGVATFATSSLPVGAYDVFAFYSGNAGFAASEADVTGTINALRATATTLVVAPNPGGAGQAITLTATVAPIPTGSPLGTVNFYSGESLIGTGTVNASGVATLTTTGPTTIGMYTITAVYSGNTLFAASTSTGVSVSIVTAFEVTAPQTPFTVAQGGVVTVAVTVPPIGGAFNNVVTMSATGQPTGSTVTFSPPMVTPGAAGTTTTMTVQLPKLIAEVPPAGVPSTPERRVPIAPFGLAALGALLLAWAFGKTRLVRIGLATAGLAASLLLFAGCNGGLAGGSSATPGMYVVTVTGTSGALHASTTVTIVVSK